MWWVFLVVVHEIQRLSPLGFLSTPQKILTGKNLLDPGARASSDEFMCKVAESPEEVSELIEAGFDCVTDLEGKKFFRKRK